MRWLLLSGVGSPDLERRRLVDERALGVGHWVKSLFKQQKTPRSHEDRAVHLAVGFLALPIPCATSWDAIDARWRRWRASPPSIPQKRRSRRPLVDGARSGPSLELFDELALRKEAPFNASLAALTLDLRAVLQAHTIVGPPIKALRGGTSREVMTEKPVRDAGSPGTTCSWF